MNVLSVFHRTCGGICGTVVEENMFDRPSHVYEMGGGGLIPRTVNDCLRKADIFNSAASRSREA